MTGNRKLKGLIFSNGAPGLKKISVYPFKALSEQLLQTSHRRKSLNIELIED